MHAIVPDTFQGAVIVSIIDFFLSFLIISGIGVVLALFPLLNRVAAFLNGHTPGHGTHGRLKDAANAKSAHEDPLLPVAVISAAVTAMLDGAPNRVVSIMPVQGTAWVNEARMRQYGSHRLRR